MMKKQMTMSAEWPMGIRMTDRLCWAIGVLQDTSKNGEALFLRQVKSCRRYAKKYGWDETYFSEAVEWCAVAAANAVIAMHRRHERIKYADAFVWSHLSQALKRNRHGRLVIPLWKREYRLNAGTTTVYADCKEDL